MLVTIAQHEIRFQLGKNDVWDSRDDSNPAEAVLTQDDLIRYVCARTTSPGPGLPREARLAQGKAGGGAAITRNRRPRIHGRTERSMSAYSGPAP